MITWLKIHLGWMMQTVRALTVPKRGVLVPEGTEVDWEQLFPSGFRLLRRQMGGGAQLLLAGALASALSRS